MKTYICRGCTASRGEKTGCYSLMDVAGQFHPALLESLPVVVGRSLVTHSLLALLVALCAQGMSISAMKKTVDEMYKEKFVRDHLAYLRHVDLESAMSVKGHYRTKPELFTGE